MAEDFIDPSYDDAFAGLEIPGLTFPSFQPTLPSLSSTPFSLPVPIASTHPLDLVFGQHCPHHLSDNIASPFYSLTSASSAALFSSATNTLAPNFGIGRSHGLRCPQHSSTSREQPPRHFFHSLPFSSQSRHRGNFATPGPSLAFGDPSRPSFPGPSNLPRVLTPGPQAPNNDEFFLNALVEGDFSSPSILSGNVRGSSPTATTAAPPDPSRQRSFEPEFGSQGGGERLAFFSEILRSSPPTNTEMPTQRHATGSSARGVARPSPRRVRKRSEAATPSPDSKKRKHDDFLKSEDDLFGEDNMAVIDLANTEEVPAALKVPPKPKNMVRLGKFQCVVCMDDTTTLTVTHCGHLFCGECLHSALHINDDKKICPICRQKVDVRPSGVKFSPRHKGYYPLQLKIMTKKSLGKRVENP